MTNCANGAGYATTLAILGTRPPAVGQPFISPDLGVAGTIVKSGYNITYAAVGTAVATAACNAATYCHTELPCPGCSAGVRTPRAAGYFGTSEAQTVFQNGHRCGGHDHHSGRLEPDTPIK